MEVSEKLNLALSLGWVVDHEWWQVWLITLGICPIAMLVIGVVFEGRWVPLSTKHQFWAFFPGNPALATFITFSARAVDEQSETWRLSPVLNVVALVVALAACIGMTRLLDFKVYKPRQMRSGTKRYHNFLYFWYGYLAAMVGVAMWASPVSFTQKALTSIPLAFWLACLVIDTPIVTPLEKLKHKWRVAHDGDWIPIWSNRWHIRRLRWIRGRRNWEYV